MPHLAESESGENNTQVPVVQDQQTADDDELARKLQAEEYGAEAADAEPKPAVDEYSAQTKEDKTEAWESAQEIKAAGNAQFKAGCADDALECYTGALGFLEKVKDWSTSDVLTADVRELRISLHLNMAACQLQQEKWTECIESTEKVLTIQGKNLKALYRRGVSNARLGRLTTAKEDLTYVAKNDLKNKQARQELTAVKDRIKQAKQDEKDRMKDMFKGKSVYSDAMAAQAEKAAAAKRKEDEKKLKEETLDAQLEDEWAEQSAARDAADEQAQSAEEDWVEESARRLEQGEEAAVGGAHKAEEFEEFKVARAKRKAEELERARKAFIKSRKKEIEDEESEKEKATKDAEKEAERRREEEREARRRARIAADQNTTLELDDEDQALLADIKKDGYCYFAKDSAKAKAGLEAQGYKQAPKRIDAAEAEAAKASGGGASDWNKSGTTFEERDHTTWAKEELKNLLLGAQAAVEDGGDSAQAKVTKLDRSEGTATTVISQGNKKPHFEFELKVEWEMTLNSAEDGEISRKLKGYTSYPDLSSKSLKDRTFENYRHFTKAPTDADVALADKLLEVLVDSINSQLDAFAAVFEAK